MDNAYPHIETAADYAEYERAVARFWDAEGIENLSTGHIHCPDCGEETRDAWLETGTCPECGQSRECADEPYFTWSACECCGRSLGGNREHATGYHRRHNDIREYEICTDCAYYAEYGQLDDMTMLRIRETA